MRERNLVEFVRTNPKELKRKERMHAAGRKRDVEKAYLEIYPAMLRDNKTG